LISSISLPIVPDGSDPLAQLVTLVRPQAVHFCKLIEGRGNWALTFAANPSINFGLILAGSCLLIKEGAANVLLEAGDFLFLSRPSDYSLASDVNVSPLKAEPALAAATSDCLVVVTCSPRTAHTQV